jgi:protein TonB
MIRTATSLLLGLLVTLATFWLMMRLVAVAQPGGPEPPRLGRIDFLRWQAPEPPAPAPAPPPEPAADPPPREMPEVELQLADRAPTPPRPRLQTGRLALSGMAHDLDIAGAPYLGDMLPDPAPARPRPLLVLSRIPPLYPRRALRRRIEGWVELRLTIDPEGRVSTARVLQSHPPGTFDRAALKAVRRWRFQAPEESGPVQATQKIEFKLDS